jgi:uncharacterized protein (DUF885 family)
MKYQFVIFAFCVFIFSCKGPASASLEENKSFNFFIENYYENRLKLYPLEATYNGDNRYNDQLTIDISESFRGDLRKFLFASLDTLQKFHYDELNDNDRLSYDVLKTDVDLQIEGLEYHDNYMPVNQFSSMPLEFGQLGSGESAQPFKTVKDYDNWLKRLDIYTRWLDTSIVYFRKGIDSNIVLPKSVVVKMIPQAEAMTTTDTVSNLFFSPVKTMPGSFSEEDRTRLRKEFSQLIVEKLVPAYKRLAVFLKEEYLPHARLTSGINGIPNGDKYYRYLVRLNTTTNKTPGEIYNIGLSEVKRIKDEMEKTKLSTGYTGDLASFIEYLKTDKKFMPYKTPGEVLNAFRKIYNTIQPNLAKLFTDTPKTRFEIRRTEAFREASASAEYNQGAADGSRPGIFYIPVLDASKFNITSGMESLFLHEAIPGHHYQISMQMENMKLPSIRRFGGNNAYVEGWALYCESLGKELGLYTDPYQYMGALGDEMHRAIRLVVDVGLHTKNMSREEAIQYMMDNEAINEQGATAEVERYMVWPGQALSYKIGALKIAALRVKYQNQLGNKFSLASFHTEVLKDGPLPLDVLEKKMDLWASLVR